MSQHEVGSVIVSAPPRYRWPKYFPPLTPEQRKISDDFMARWHEVLPRKYGVVEKFNHGYPLRHLPKQERWRTIEIGAGVGAHLGVEDLSRQEYHCVERRGNMACEIRRRFPQVTVMTEDCQKTLSYPTAYFDRAIAVHVLEHLPDLPAAVDELARLLRPGGILSIVVPCDPGVAYELARKISAERIFKQRYRMPYKWLIRREHINKPAEIFWVLRQRFHRIDRKYFPLRIPVVSVNLCIGATFVRR